jgi:hypothetical protein
MKRRAIIIGLTLLPLLLYVGSYVPLTMGGSYQRTPKGYIGMNYWRPAGLSHDSLGYVYWPLLKIDHSFVHRPYFSC